MFLFLSTTITNGEMIKYQRENMVNFIRQTFDICKSHSDEFGNIMEKML